MRAARWSAVAVAVLLLAGCGQAHRQTHRQTRDSTLHLTAKDNHKVFNFKPHEAFVVTLASNRSTGYRWVAWPSSHPLGVRLAPVSSQPPLRLVSHRYVPPKEAVPGALGKEIWRFRTVSHGGRQETGILYMRKEIWRFRTVNGQKVWYLYKPPAAPARDVSFVMTVS